MIDKVNIELDKQFLDKFFALTDRMVPEGDEITLLMLKKQVAEVEDLLITSKLNAQPSNSPSPMGFQQPAGMDDFSSTFGDDGFNLPKKNILIIDDLGVITYQLAVLFKKLGFETTSSKEIYDAIEKFKKQDFDLVIMDLYIPTEREGFILLEELKKTAMNKRKPTKIGVMSASSKKEYKQLCKIKGAEFFIEKVDDWQKELLTVIGIVV